MTIPKPNPEKTQAAGQTQAEAHPKEPEAQEKKEATTSKPPKGVAPAAAKPAGGRRRRVNTKAVEKKKEPKVIEVTAEIDSEIFPGKAIYLPELDLK